MSDKSPLHVSTADADGARVTFSHPWNDKSDVRLSLISRAVGMERSQVCHVIVPPGKESFVYHSHHHEEEWVYILAGRGTTEIDGEVFEVGPGDFMGFPTPSVAHHLVNSGSEDLIYLMGGECLEEEVADFPRLGKRKIRKGGDEEVVDIPVQEK